MNIESIKLRRGRGNGDPKNGLCLMQAVDWFSGRDKLSDHPECASPVLCVVGIQLNDMAPNQAVRDQLWPLVWQLLDSRDPAAEQARVEHIVRETTHRVVAPVFDCVAPDHAAALRAANSMPGIEKAAAEAARKAGWAAEAARKAGWAAEAAAAVWAAMAAEEAAAEEAAAVWAAMAAAEAARKAGTAETARKAVWDEFRLIFIEAIALGKHGEADPIYEPRAAELLRILELAE